MFARRTRRTDLELANSGDFAKIGKKHWRHVSGLEIKYDCNAWSWEACGMWWPTLAGAAHWVRREAEKKAAA